MLGIKSRFVMKSIFSLIFFLTFSLAHAKDREYRVGDTAQLLGFSSLEYELAINPCLSDVLVHFHYGEQGVAQAKENLKQYPEGLCQHQKILSMYSNWNYNASALLANTERPFILGREIAINHSQLKQCKTLACLEQRLPRMLNWSKLTLSRTPIASRDVAPLSMGAAPINHPQLALRGLKLPLSKQKQTCGSDSLSALTFAASSLIVADRALAVVTCQSKDKQGIWLLERNEQVGKWTEILALPGIEHISVLPYNRELYPHIFYKEKKGFDATITILRYSEETGYKKRLQFDVSDDAYGLSHAFHVQVF